MIGGVRVGLDSHGPAENMAIDQALLESVDRGGKPTLRFYRWAEPTLSLGYFQAVGDRALHAASREVACVRRSTGGGAILHDAELTYSLVMPLPRSDTGARTELYRGVHAAVAATLAEFRVTASPYREVGGRLHKDRGFLCFQRRTDEDLIVRGYKVLGSAQRRGRRAVLQHGSLLLRASRYAPELPGILDLVGGDVPLSALVDSLTARLSRQLSVRWTAAALDPTQLERAAEISRDRFAADSWLLRR